MTDNIKRDIERIIANAQECDIDALTWEEQKERLKAVKSADVEPVRHGWWKDLDDTEFRVNGWYCSQCLYEISDRYGKYRYCPMCGAKMDEEVEA